MEIKTKEDWWSVFNSHKDDLRSLVSNFHPVCRNEEFAGEFSISAGAAEEACEHVRKAIVDSGINPSPVEEFDRAIASNDHNALIRLLNQTWFGIPESYDSRELPGFFPLCDLCSESWVFEEGDENA